MSTMDVIDPAAGLLPASARLGEAELVVSDLDAALAFYTGPLGLREVARDGASAHVGTGSGAVLALREEPEARPAGRHGGLYHVALLFPSRLELARVGRRLAETATPIQGASDHGTHEAIYLADPAGNGLELAADRPPEQWPDIHDIEAIRPAPLDQAALFGTLGAEGPVAEAGDGVVVGHLHLHVGDLPAATAFWRDVVGFGTVFALDSATFLAAGGYHHHVGLNTWQGVGVPPRPEGVVGLDHGTLVLPDAADVAAVRERAAAAGVPVEELGPDAIGLVDPAGNRVRVVAEGTA